MNTLATIRTTTTRLLEAGEICQVVILYTDASAHGDAMEYCGRLVAQLGNEPAFAFHCCKFQELADPMLAQQAAEAAARADILLIATHGDDLPPAVRQWLDLCYRLRTESEGALALLLAEPVNAFAPLDQLMTRLEIAARRLKMDFLPLVPPSAQSIIQRLRQPAHTIIPFLQDVLNGPPPNHWGLNE